MKSLLTLAILLAACASHKDARDGDFETFTTVPEWESVTPAEWRMIARKVLQHTDKEEVLLPIFLRLSNGDMEMAWLKPDAFDRVMEDRTNRLKPRK